MTSMVMDFLINPPALGERILFYEFLRSCNTRMKRNGPAMVSTERIR
jgi:hypothetical protein